MPINLHFCNRLGSFHQLAPIVEDVSEMVLDGVCLAHVRAMSFKAYLTEEGLLSQAEELRRLVEMKLQLLEVEAEVVMRSSLTCFWYIFHFLPRCAHLDDGLLFLINFYSYFLVARLYKAGSL